MSSQRSPAEEVLSGKSRVAVYGVGYVGTALIAAYLRRGLNVVGVDIDEDKLRAVAEGRFKYYEEEIREAIVKGIRSGRLELMSDGREASARSAIKIVTVPVYFRRSERNVDFSSLVSAVADIGSGMHRGDLVIVESSVPPGTTEGIVRRALENASGLRAEDDFYLAYSPERVYIGRALKDIEINYPKVIGGLGPKSLEEASRFYEAISEKGVIKLSSTRAAEFEKLAEGVYRDVNIALANELALAAQKLGINYYEARDAANSQPYCHLHLPGPGVGGYCIPLYPYFLMMPVLKEGFVMELTMVARRINEGMPLKVTSQVVELAQTRGLAPENSKVVILGDAFRGNIDDVRLSPTHDVIASLLANGFKNIVVHDPYVERDDYLKHLGITLTKDLGTALGGADIAVICVRHNAYRSLKTSDMLRLSRNKSLLIYDAVGIVEDDAGLRTKGLMKVLGSGV